MSICKWVMNLNSGGLLRSLSAALLYSWGFCKGSRGQIPYAKRWDLISASLSSIPGFMELPTCFLFKRLFACSEAVGSRSSPALKLMPCELHPKNPQRFKLGVCSLQKLVPLKKFRSPLLQAGTGGSPNRFFGLDQRARNLCCMVQAWVLFPSWGSCTFRVIKN